MADGSTKKYIVVGGAGNLGGQIVSVLTKFQHVSPLDIVSIDLVQHKDAAIKSQTLDISKADAVGKLQDIFLSSCQSNKNVELVVFHTASMIDIRPIPSERMFAVNVDGTKHVLEACKAVNARGIACVLVYTSSLECVSGRNKDRTKQLLKRCGEDEITYPFEFFLPYARTKAQAEQMVLKAHGTGEADKPLRTVSIRPGYILGSGCIGLKLEILRAIERNLTKPVYITAKVPAEISCVDVRNCAVAHVLAVQKIRDHNVAGKAFFCRDFESNVVDINIFGLQGSPVGVLLLPFWLVIPIAWILDRFERFMHWLLGPGKRETSQEVIDFNALNMAWHDVVVSGDKAVKHLGYGTDKSFPLISKEQCLDQTRTWAHGFIKTTLDEKLNQNSHKKEL